VALLGPPAADGVESVRAADDRIELPGMVCTASLIKARVATRQAAAPHLAAEWHHIAEVVRSLLDAGSTNHPR